mgnify:CR=1
MDHVIIKIECLKMALTGTPETTIASAQKYYDWIVPKLGNPKLGRPPKKDK